MAIATARALTPALIWIALANRLLPILSGPSNVSSWRRPFGVTSCNVNNRSCSSPTVVMLSFTDIGGVPLEGKGARTAAKSGRIATVSDYYQNLLLPELVVESFVASSTDIYGPLFEMVWNAARRTTRPPLER